jgi:hypothetical protein
MDIEYTYEDTDIVRDVEQRWLALFIRQSKEFVRHCLNLLPDEVKERITAKLPLTFSRGHTYLMLIIDISFHGFPLHDITIYVIDRPKRPRMAHYITCSPIIEDIQPLMLPRLCVDEHSGELPSFRYQ